MQIKNIFFWVAVLKSVLVVAILAGQASAQATVDLTTDNLQDGKKIDLTNVEWKYRASDELNWAKPEYDDSQWEILNATVFQADKLPMSGWNGLGWFRLKVNVEESLITESISLRLQHFGASEIYLDGRLIKNFGVIGAIGDVEINSQSVPVPLTFGSPGNHIIAIRYSSKTQADLSKGLGKWLARGRYLPGFSAFLQTTSTAINSYTVTASALNYYHLFVGVLYALALLHLLIFIFYRRERANFYYSFFAFSLGIGTTILTLNSTGGYGAFPTAVLFILFVILYCGSFIALLTFLYVAFAEKLSRIYWFLSTYLVGLTVIMTIYSRAALSLYVVIIFMLLAVADALRIMIVALREKREGAWIVMSGVLIFAIGVLLLLAPELKILQSSSELELFRSINLYLAIPIAVSIYLARQFAHTNRNLATQLDNVQQLSVQQIEHERRENDLRVAHERTQAENERRAKELEEARQLQLLMLPKKLPQISNLQIATYMRPASEVGGDYYDFHLSDDGTLTIAVGDATGHGLKAGTVVTATKSLFNAFAAETDITNIFRQTSAALKKMNLRGLFMAMTMLKIKDNILHTSSAGMPATLLFRAETKRVEEIFIKALPLGSTAKFPYERREISLLSGDCIVVMSDGFPEMFNPQNEILGFDEAARVLSNVADCSPQEIINRFVEVGAHWADDRPADDDVTFVVIKVI